MGQYKMKHQGVPALMKALVGDQHKLPQHLKEAIKAAPEKSPVRKEEPSGNGKKYDRLRKKMDKLDDKFFDTSKPRSERQNERILDKHDRVRKRAIKARKKNAKKNS